MITTRGQYCSAFSAIFSICTDNLTEIMIGTTEMGVKLTAINMLVKNFEGVHLQVRVTQKMENEWGHNLAVAQRCP